MSKKSDTYYALLGLITIGCHTGYEIKQMMDRSLQHFWTISYSQIYPNLKRLTEEGLLTVTTTVQEDRPDKKEYHLTQKGEDALQDWLNEPVKQPAAEKNELPLKLFFSDKQDTASNIRMIEHYKLQLNMKYELYETIEQSLLKRDGMELRLFTIDYGKRVTAAAIEWADAVISKLQKGDEL